MSRSTKTRTRKNPTAKPAPRAALPVRPAPTTDFITEGQIRAHYKARLANLPHTPITAWTPLPNGTHQVHLPTGALLTHTTGTETFTAHTPCPQGAHHTADITNGHELETAVTTTALCTNPHGQPRTLTLHQAAATAADTQQLSRDDIDAGLTADHDQTMEHPES